jgi:folate-binding protein YgfZ
MTMKPEWKSFLETFGAEFSDGKVASFGNDERERRVITTGETLCDLSQFGLISAYGEQAAEFLQNMLSNDINAVTEAHSQLSALCSQKGRMLSNFRIFKRDETYYIRLPQEMLETTLKRLQMFVLMTKITLEDASNALVRFGYSGPDAAETLKAYLGEIPEAFDDTLESKNITVIRVPGTQDRFELYGELEDMQALWNHLNVRAVPVGSDAWLLQDILAGLPNIYEQTSESFVPQMANMHLVNGVSFKKGCYPGQEVVARMQYLGKLKRRMHLLDIPGTEAPLPGTDIMDGEEPKAVGEIVDARRNGDGSISALAVIQVANENSGNLIVGDDSKAPVTVSAPPYAFSDES